MKTVENYFKKRKKTISGLLTRPASKFTPAAFHLLRVEIKKLKAILDLLEYCSVEIEQKKLFKPFKKLFQKAGVVRELQLEASLLKKMTADNSIEEYITKLNKRQNKSTRSFFLNCNEALPRKIDQRFESIIPLLPIIGKKCAQGQLEKLRLRISKIIQKDNLRIGDLHNLRKLLKTHQYTVSMVSQAEAKKDKAVANFMNLIGKWHDLRVIAKDLNKVKDMKNLSGLEIERILLIIERILSDADELFCKIDVTRRKQNIEDSFLHK
jgi:CHAD domain-containing protein